mgnify:CR=1 FL=1
MTKLRLRLLLFLRFLGRLAIAAAWVFAVALIVWNLARLYPGAAYKAATRQITVPMPATKKVGGQPLRDAALIDWVGGLIRSVLLDSSDHAPAPAAHS